MDPATLKLGPIPYLALIPLLPLAGAFFNLVAGRRLPRSLINLFAIGSVLLACALSIYMVFGYPSLAGKLHWEPSALWREFKLGNGGTGIEQTAYTWMEVGNFKAQLAFRLDTLSAVMIL